MTVSEPQTDRYEPTIAAAAVRLGVNPRTLAGWLAEGAPGKTDEGYDVQAIEDWRALNRQSAASTTSTGDPDVEVWKVRKLVADTLEAEAKARLKGYEAEKTTEDVVHLDAVDQFLSGLFTEFRRQLARVPKQMGPSFPEEIREQMQEELADQLDLIARSMHGYCQRVTELRDS